MPFDVGRVALFLVVSAIGIGGAGLSRSAARGPAPGAWPGLEAVLTERDPVFSSDFGRRRVFLDAGHGAPENSGNLSAFCVEEQSFTLKLAEDVGHHLATTDHFDVELSRRGSERIPYPERVAHAESWGADVFVSLHSDVRGRATSWSPQAGVLCPQSHDAPGFSILWSDSGQAPLVSARALFARALALELVLSGFMAYDGAGYVPLYAADQNARGVFVDRRPERERIFVLWRPSMPSLIVETHNALDDREAARWEQPRTKAAFAKALARALVRTLSSAMLR